MRAVYFLLGVSILVLFISLTSYFIDNRTLETHEFYASLNISDDAVVGFDINDSALIFGTVGKGITSTRRIKIDNKYSFPIIVFVRADGAIKEFLNFEDVVRIDRNMTALVAVSAFAPFDTTAEGYSGTVEFLLKPA